MATTKSEKKVQTEIMKEIKAAGWYVIKVIKANESGVHDLLACINGLFISIEVKAERFTADPFKQASAWQKKHYRLVIDANGIAMVIASVEQFKQTLIQHQVNLVKI